MKLRKIWSVSCYDDMFCLLENWLFLIYSGDGLSNILNVCAKARRSSFHCRKRMFHSLLVTQSINQFCLFSNIVMTSIAYDLIDSFIYI